MPSRPCRRHMSVHQAVAAACNLCSFVSSRPPRWKGLRAAGARLHRESGDHPQCATCVACPRERTLSLAKAHGMERALKSSREVHRPSSRSDIHEHTAVLPEAVRLSGSCKVPQARDSLSRLGDMSTCFRQHKSYTALPTGADIAVTGVPGFGRPRHELHSRDIAIPC